MGKIEQGILGGFTGKVGTVIGWSWKGRAIMRAKALSIKNPHTDAQTSQRVKFAISQRFLKPIASYVRVGFRNYDDDKTPYNAAMSYFVRNSITGQYPAFGIDPSAVMLSRGALMPGRYCTATVTGNVAAFAWEDNSDESQAEAGDFVMPIVYNFTKNEAVFQQNVASRADCKGELKLPADWSGDMMSCYISFAGATDKKISNSVYVGDVKSDGTVVAKANGVFSCDDVVDETRSGNTGGSTTSSTTVKYNVTLAASPINGGIVTGAGEYVKGTSATLKATPASGYTFSKWSDGNTDAQRNITVNEDTALSAIFISNTGGGSGEGE